MAEAPPTTSAEMIGSGFPPAAKFMLLCSPLFMSLPHAWRMIALQSLSELRPDLRLIDMYHFLGVEIMFSVLSVPVSMLADAAIGLKATLLSFMSATCVAPLLGCIAGLPGFSLMNRVYMLKAGAGFTGLGVIVSVLERAFFVRLMNVNSPAFRLYCFLDLFLGIVWQVANSTVLYIPKMFPSISENYYLLAWITIVYQCTLWSYMIIMYSVVARVKPESNPGGNSFKVLVCIYLAIFYAMKMIWARLRWKELKYKDIFEACERWYPKHVVVETRQTFRLFMVVMCLMYLFGMELILRSIWFHQDDELSRDNEPSIMKVFPLDMLLLLYLLILYPIVNFLLLPFIKKKLHFRLTDLRLVGISLILYNVSYIATMALEWTVMSASVSSPHSSNVALRIYNCMLNPVAWTVKNPQITPVTIYLPGRMSRAFINDKAGKYQIFLNSTVHNNNISLEMKKGKPRVFILRGGAVEDITIMERQLSAVPDHYGEDTHLFVVNGLLNTTYEYLAKKRVQVSWRNRNGHTQSENIASDFTHIILQKDTYDITLKLGNTKFDLKNIEMKDHGVYSIVFYDAWGGTDEGYEFDTVSEGFAYSRAWANVQVILLALAMSVGQIPMIHYTYKNAPPDLLATCFSFHRCACAMSTFLVWFVTSNYGLGPGPSTISTMFIIMFTVFFIFLSVSDIVPSDDEAGRQVQSAGDDLTADSGSLKFMKSILDVSPQETERKPKSQFFDQESIASEKEKR